MRKLYYGKAMKWNEKARLEDKWVKIRENKGKEWMSCWKADDYYWICGRFLTPRVIICKGEKEYETTLVGLLL